MNSLRWCGIVRAAHRGPGQKTGKKENQRGGGGRAGGEILLGMALLRFASFKVPSQHSQYRGRKTKKKTMVTGGGQSWQGQQ